MMRKIFTLLLSAFVAVLTLWADAVDRVDAVRTDGTFVSFMTNDVDSITYVRTAGSDTYGAFRFCLSDGSKPQFSMSEYPSLRYVPVDATLYAIFRESDPHATIVMLDCINNDHLLTPDESVDWTGTVPNHKVHFLVRTEVGYDSQTLITGVYTGKDYTADPSFVFIDAKENNLIGQDAPCFYMPNEPVTITTIATERTVYEGYDFVGEYTGYGLTPAADSNGISRGTTAPFTMQLRASGACRGTSTDEMKYDFLHLYDYDAAKGTFSYHVEELAEDEEPDLEYRDQPTHGANGVFFAGDVAIVNIHDYNNDKHENTRFYVTCKEPFSFVCASRDVYGYQYLVEVVPDSGVDPTWYFLSDYGNNAVEATIDFTKGSSIGEPCEAIVSYAGDTQLKYTLGQDGVPTFRAKGKEAGNYTDITGQGGTLSLDGFGVASYGDRLYAYTIESNVVSITVSGEPVLFHIDPATHTYTLVQESEWPGYEIYENNAVSGVYCEEDATTRNSVKVWMDHNLMGAEKPGYAALSISIYHEGRYVSAVSDCQRYLYDATTRSLTLSNVLMGDGAGSSHRANLTFTLSEDGKSLYLPGTADEARIYSVSYTGSYVTVDAANALQAYIPVAPELYDNYSANLAADYLGNTLDAEATLALDADLNGQAKEGYAALHVSAMGSDIISACVPYEIEGMTLTLKGVTVGDGNYGEQTVDLQFTITDDARLLGQGTYYGTGMTAALMQVDLASQEFLPALPGVELAAKYTGLYYIGTNGEEAEVATVQATLCIDRTADGTLQPGYAFFEAKAAAGKFGSKSVPYEISGNKLILKDYGVKETDTEDLIFEILSDGTLQATGMLYGTGSITNFYIDLSKAVLSPAE